ncbi:MAG: putative solute:sodium symporter small subunit, partial [Glaciecola sp.]
MENKTTYWQENLRLIAICLVIWFIVSFGFG